EVPAPEPTVQAPEPVPEPGAADAGEPQAGLARWLVGAVVILLLIPAGVRRVRSWGRRAAIARGDRAAEHAWAEVEDTALDLGHLPRDPMAVGPRARTAEAVLEYLEAHAALDHRGAAAAEELARAYGAERYADATVGAPSERDPGPAKHTAGPAPHTGSSRAPVGDLLTAAVGGLRSRAGRAARIRAVLLPPSVLRSPAGRGGRAEDQSPVGSSA
nr:hypothetical protein [Actinomycetales bacterium]